MRADAAHSLRVVRVWVAVFIVGLVLSGVTAFPLTHEIVWLVRIAAHFHLDAHTPNFFGWLMRVRDALMDESAHYPFLAYGTDWLAFGHLVIATAFLALYREPVRNRWLVDFGLIACAGVVPLAMIAGAVRGIPIFWRGIDCSFGVFGCIPLLLVRRHIDNLERAGVKR